MHHKVTITENFQGHSSIIPEQNPGMQVLQIGNLKVINSGLPCDTFNVIHVQGPFEEGELNEALAIFKGNNFPFCLWITQEQLNLSSKALLQKEGLQCQAEEAGMSLDLATYDPIITDKHHHIKKAKTPEMVRDFSQVIAKNWSPPDAHVIDFYEKTAQNFLQHDQFSLLTYYQNDIPVATVEVFISNEKVAGIHGLATLEDTRGQGIGSALMTRVLNEAKTKGFETAVLLATPDGLGIYEKLGFVSHTRFYEYS